MVALKYNFEKCLLLKSLSVLEGCQYCSLTLAIDFISLTFSQKEEIFCIL